MVAPDNIWIAGLLDECGAYYSSAVEAEGGHGGTAVEYARVTPDTIPLSRAEVEALMDGVARLDEDGADLTSAEIIREWDKVRKALATLQERMK